MCSSSSNPSFRFDGRRESCEVDLSFRLVLARIAAGLSSKSKSASSDASSSPGPEDSEECKSWCPNSDCCAGELEVDSEVSAAGGSRISDKSLSLSYGASSFVIVLFGNVDLYPLVSRGEVIEFIVVDGGVLPAIGRRG